MSFDGEVGPRIPLVEGLNLRDLLEKKEIEFSVHTNKEEALLECAEHEFDAEAIIQNSNPEIIDPGDTANTPFEQIRSKMVKLTEDGMVMKRIQRQGIGEVVKPDAAVTVNYNGYFEFNDTPFDSTSLRGQQARLQLGDSSVVPGLNLAISSMRKFEKADFILHPLMAYGVLGCPPRIPANTEVFFEVELVDWHEDVNSAFVDTLSREDQTSWEKVRDFVKKSMAAGKAKYDNRLLKDAKFKFRKAIDIASNCNLKNEEEEKEQQKLLFKMYVNLAIVLNDLPKMMQTASQACVACREACKIQPNSPKVHLQWGRALITLGETDRASEHLRKALKLAPNDEMINQELEKLEKKLKKENEESREMWTRAFRMEGSASNERTAEDAEESEEMKKCREMLKTFKLDESRKKMVLPIGLTSQEANFLHDTAMGMELDVHQGDRCVTVTKRNTS